MNIDTARTIPVSEILSKINVYPKKKTGSSEWYLSPFRNERTPSFKVNTAKNIWYDFGENRGGDGIDFVCAYLEGAETGNTVADALRWIDNMFSGTTSFQIFAPRENAEEESRLMLKSVKPLTHIALIRYLEDRGITKAVAEKYLKEITLYNTSTQKEFFAAAIKNEDGGYDYRNLYFKGCVKKKAITFVRGAIPGNDGIHIFEGFMDFLSVITSRQGMPFYDDTIILNSVSCLKEATAYMRGYGYRGAYTWFDNDEAGKKAAAAFDEFLRSENIQHKPMNIRYAAYKDVNEAFVKQLGL